MSGSLSPSPPSLLLPYLCHRSAVGSASGVLFSTCVPFPAKKADSCLCEDVVGQDGEELRARFRFRFGVSRVEELLGIQPSVSSGDLTSGSSFFACSSKLPIKSSSGNLAPGVQGKVLEWPKDGVLTGAACDDLRGSVEGFSTAELFSTGKPPILLASGAS